MWDQNEVSRAKSGRCAKMSRTRRLFREGVPLIFIFVSEVLYREGGSEWVEAQNVCFSVHSCAQFITPSCWNVSNSFEPNITSPRSPLVRGRAGIDGGASSAFWMEGSGKGANWKKAVVSKKKSQ